ncbi:MAG: M48 family metalloprotease [Pelagimonas sp.]|jgi:Zn-dependent protease with chaperone function|nr:M48 family metalloprotease [Pelagimonas sp.]
MFRIFAALTALVALAACEPVPQSVARPSGDSRVVVPQNAARQFVQVVKVMEPHAEKECRNRTRGLNCDFQIVVDDRPDLPPNALQTEDKSGRPVLVFTASLLNEVRNEDELAFVIGHEAAHHILSHLEETRRNAQRGAVIMSGMAAILGASPDEVAEAEKAGATVGVLAYSKDHELEADQLGTIITYGAGFDPINGARFFNRLPEPRNKFLSTHPGSKQRVQIVHQTVARLKAGS